MKKIIILLLTIISFQVFAQNYEEVYARYVGTKDDSYPLTVEGVQSAIESLRDTGVIYIAYPGVDTTGLGAIPPNIHLQGWISYCKDYQHGRFESVLLELSSDPVTVAGTLTITLDGDDPYIIPVDVGDTTDDILSFIDSLVNANSTNWIAGIFGEWGSWGYTYVNPYDGGFSLGFLSTSYNNTSAPTIVNDGVEGIHIDMYTENDGIVGECLSGFVSQYISLFSSNSTTTVYTVTDSSYSIQEKIDLAYTNGGGLVMVYPGLYVEQLTMKNGVDLYFYPGAKLTTNNTGGTIVWTNTCYDTKIYGSGVFESTSINGTVLAVSTSIGEHYAYVEADSIINTGVPTYIDPNSSSTTAVRNQAKYFTLNANYVGSSYGVGIWSTSSSGKVVINVKEIVTGLSDNYDSGTTAVIFGSTNSSSYVNIEKITVNNIGHAISARGGYFNVHLGTATVKNNRSNYASGIALFNIEQGSNDQWGEFYFDKLEYLYPDTIHVGKTLFDATAPVIKVGQGKVGSRFLFKGNLIKTPMSPDSTEAGAGFFLITATNTVTVSLDVDEVYGCAKIPIYFADRPSLDVTMRIGYFYNQGEYDNGETAVIWSLTDNPYLTIKNSTFEVSDNVGTNDLIYFENRVDGKVVFDNVNFISNKTTLSSGTTMRFYPTPPDTITGKIYVYNKFSSNQPFSDEITWRGDTSDVWYNNMMINGLSILGNLFVEDGINYGTDGQVSDSYVVNLSGITTLSVGLEVSFKANTSNTDGATLQINSLTPKALTKVSSGSVSTPLATGDIIAGQIVRAVYDGTQFQIISKLAQ